MLARHHDLVCLAAVAHEDGCHALAQLLVEYGTFEADAALLRWAATGRAWAVAALLRRRAPEVLVPLARYLEVASVRGHTPVVKALLRAGGSALDGTEALHLAAAGGHRSTVICLLRHRGCCADPGAEAYPQDDPRLAALMRRLARRQTA